MDANLFYLAGDVTTDGRNFVVIGSDSDGMDSKLFTIDLMSGNFEVTQISFEKGTRTVDIGFHPLTSLMYGFDALERRFYTHTLGNTAIALKAPIFTEYNVKGMYFEAFGNMFGLGTALFGSISGLFEVDQTTGATKLISTSGLIPIADMAACPYSFEMNSKIIPEVFFPCSDLLFEYAFANQTGELLKDVLLEHELPSGYTFKKPENVPFGGVLDMDTPDNLLRIEKMSIPVGIQNYTIEAYVDDIAKAKYKSQVSLSNVPAEFGNVVLSNNPITATTEDSTVMEVNRIEEDSLEFLSFVCHGRSITFDASDYGNNLQWSTGATSQKISVGETGLFTVTAESGCQDLTVNYEVVSASCPYTIELRHLVEPNMVFGCSEATFRYILENDSGEERFGVILLDTLPDGFTFSRIVNNPYESELTEDLPPNVFQLEKLVLAEGIDTIDIVVNVGDLPPGGVQNKAQLKGLSPVLGKIRSSDNPFTLAFPDSTIFFVRGVNNDSLKVDTFLCRDETILLDASFYGESYLWDNGSTESQIPISATGAYQVMIFDGCGTAQVQFNVEQGKEIEVDFLEDAYFIHQGESINLNPDIFNSGDSLHIEWYDERSTNSLSCLNCPQPIATPLSNINYLIYAQNEACRDSAQVEIFVDETRRVYVPSAFSPNNDGINDYFYFQSPDPGTILSFQVFDRWGNLIFKQTNIPFNQETTGWNGTISGITASKGIYLWKAEILFFDGKVERWGGDVTVMD